MIGQAGAGHFGKGTIMMMIIIIIIRNASIVMFG